MFATVKGDEAVFNIAMLVVVVFVVWRLLKPKPRYSTAYGSASWADDKMFKAWGMFKRGGLVLGRYRARCCTCIITLI